MPIPVCLFLFLSAYPAGLALQNLITALYRRYPTLLRTEPAPCSLRRAVCLGLPALLLGLLAAPAPFSYPLWLLTWLLYLVLLLITVTDIEQHLIFDYSLAAGAALAFPYLLLTGADLVSRLYWGLGAGAVLFLFSMLTRGSIGGGDIKLLAFLGWWLGTGVLFVFCAGTVFGAIAAAYFILTRKKDRSAPMAYGPYFTISVLILHVLT